MLFTKAFYTDVNQFIILSWPNNVQWNLSKPNLSWDQLLWSGGVMVFNTNFWKDSC